MALLQGPVAHHHGFLEAEVQGSSGYKFKLENPDQNLSDLRTGFLGGRLGQSAAKESCEIWLPLFWGGTPGVGHRIAVNR